MKIEISIAVTEDAEDIRNVYADAYAENRLLGFPATAETAAVEDIQSWIQQDRLWVAKIEGVVVGAVRLRDTDPQYPTLGRLGVVTHLKGADIGSRLMSVAEAEARARGCRGITLTVAEGHPFLSKIYLKRGYVIVGPRVQQAGIYNEIVMRKSFGGRVS